MSIFSWKKKEEEQSSLRAPQLDVRRLRQTMGLAEEPAEMETENADDVKDVQEDSENGLSTSVYEELSHPHVTEPAASSPLEDVFGSTTGPLTFDTVRIPAPMLQHLEKYPHPTSETVPSSSNENRVLAQLWDGTEEPFEKADGILQFLPRKKSVKARFWGKNRKEMRATGAVTDQVSSNSSTIPASASRSLWKAVFNYSYSLLKTLSLVLVVFYFFSSYIIQRNEVTGVAMEPALYHQDQILVNRLGSYFGTIKRGDIVSIRSDRLSERVQVGELIKRVVAVGGDTVEIKNGQVYINNEPLVEPYLPAKTETLPIDLTYQKVVLDKNQYYILGDNRENSLDSRFFGPVSDSDIVGVCWFRLSPWNRFGRP